MMSSDFAEAVVSTPSTPPPRLSARAARTASVQDARSTRVAPTRPAGASVRAGAVNVALGPPAVRWMRWVGPLPPGVEALARQTLAGEGQMAETAAASPTPSAGEVRGAMPASTPSAPVTVFDQRGQTVGTQFNVAGDDVAHPAAGERATEVAGATDRDQRCADLAENIRETLELIKQYEDQCRLADDPKAKRRAEREIADLRAQLDGYETERRRLGCE